MAHSTPKRQRINLSNEQTPRANPSTSIASSSLKRSQNSANSHSHATSSRRRIQNLATSDAGISRRQMSSPQTDGLPEPVRNTLQKISLIQSRRAIFGRQDEHAFNLVRDFNLLGSEVFAPDGSMLTEEDVARIGRKGRRCFERDHDGAVWNAEVHQDLLETSIRNRTEEPLVDFTICTSMRLIKDYIPPGYRDHRIDFLLFIDPSAEPEYARKINAIRQSLPMGSINQMSYGPHQAYPLFGAIETKRPGDHFDQAMLQLAVFQAAQFVLLRHLLRVAFLRRKIHIGNGAEIEVVEEEDEMEVGEEEDESMKAYVDGALAKLGGLHGIMIQGHQWSYTAVSLDGDKTVLWLPLPIAHTSSALGIHQVSTFLRYFKDTLAVDYWSWFKQYILD